MTNIRVKQSWITSNVGRVGPGRDSGVAVGEHRCPGPERRLGEAALAPDDVDGKDVIRNQPLALALESRCEPLEGVRSSRAPI